MRLLVLALMIALLPLRSWAGDAMAVELVAQQALAAGHASASPAALDDCHPDHGHAADRGLGHDTSACAQDGPAGTDCDTCTSCQICHSVALAAVLPQAVAPVLPAVAPRSSQPRYASAEPAPGFKPPIS